MGRKFLPKFSFFVRLTYEKIVVFFWEYGIIIMSKGNTKVLRRYPSAFDGNLVSEDKAAATVSRWGGQETRVLPRR